LLGDVCAGPQQYAMRETLCMNEWLNIFLCESFRHSLWLIFATVL